MVYNLLFFSSKCSLFHNSNIFGVCIIHILYTGCAKIKKIYFWRQKVNEWLIIGWYDLHYSKCISRQFVIITVSSYSNPSARPQLYVKQPQFFVEQNWQGWHMWLSVMPWLGCRLDGTEQGFGGQQVQRHAVVNAIHILFCRLPARGKAAGTWTKLQWNHYFMSLLFFFCVLLDFEHSVISWQSACRKKNVIFPAPKQFCVPRNYTCFYPGYGRLLDFTCQNILLAPRDNAISLTLWRLMTTIVVVPHR